MFSSIIKYSFLIKRVLMLKKVEFLVIYEDEVLF